MRMMVEVDAPETGDWGECNEECTLWDGEYAQCVLGLDRVVAFYRKKHFITKAPEKRYFHGPGPKCIRFDVSIIDPIEITKQRRDMVAAKYAHLPIWMQDPN